MELKIRKISDRKYHITYRLDICCFGNKIDSVKTSIVYTIKEDNKLEFKCPKEKFFNNISMKYSVKRKLLVNNFVGMNGLCIEDEVFNIDRFLSNINIIDTNFLRKYNINKLLAE